jgi:hypothetical protein
MWQKLSSGAQLGFLRASLVLVICALVSDVRAQRPLPRPTPRDGNRRVVLPIERSARFGALLVSLEVNGKPAVLILDTGSNTTILSPEISGLSLPSLPRAAPPRKGTGFVGEGRWGRVTLKIGTTVWRDKQVLVVDTRDLSRALERKIDGILGQDILDEFQYVEINLVEKRLTLGFD